MKFEKRITHPEIRPKGLVVDDDKGWRDSFGRYLSDAGLVPTTATSLKEAEDLLDREFFHVALVDLSLVEENNRDGLSILRKIYQELREGTAATLITAYGGVEEGAEANTYGAHVIQKPNAKYPRMLKEITEGLQLSLSVLQQYRVGLNLLSGTGTPKEKQVHEYDILKFLEWGYASADTFIAKLFRDLCPVLRLRNSPNATIDQGKQLLVGTYWSKMLGSPIRLVVGKTAVVRIELDKLEAGRIAGEDDGYAQIFRVDEHGANAAAILKTSEPFFEAFDQRRDDSLYPTA
jgi:ActR/RegA family two-component response regulator